MKHFLLLLLLTFLKTGFTQTTSSDSLKNANIEFDNKILSMIKAYEQEGCDFIILRVYDTTWSFENRCRFMIRKDSCTQRFGLSMDHDYSIHHVSISYIDDYYDNGWPCHDEISEIEYRLGDYENNLSKQNLDSLYYENSAYTLYGKIDGKYFYEIHAGMFYTTICSYMGGTCNE